MTEDRLPHRLTVVWFTDLVGYSSLMAEDEDRAIALVRRPSEGDRARSGGMRRRTTTWH